MAKQAINPDSLFDSLQFGFSQIVISQGRRQVHISGQVAWDANGDLVGGDDLRAQTFEAFRNLDTAIRAAGGTLRDIVSLRIYIVERVMAQSAPVSEALRTFFPDDPPASTWIGVRTLAREAFLIEIEALAVLD
ncbi:MAG: RidA family protein [Chloroflexi bacterium]|jgi:enamine deaminase RidA (YjgF/YER057c/UK114 family)|nr:RidA family protein [Chloroflexota bacterium]